ncbi:hypothetical protein FIBSPDRAFT_926383 [Athelia psychrophila]|uniref:CoA-dependent acyltransferase n=1 Tax=Athelia psychrophila TaxID=1759441 RepID=A0A166TEI0_9AGAM|nr:hypothetical protein FIBSPDRAFT_926383 [Fibularhizoctonia sp. CBS 109695]
MFAPRRAGSVFTSLQRTLSTFQRSTRLPNRAYHGHFSSTDGRLWKRKLEGLEDFMAAICNAAAGFGHGALQFDVKPTKQLDDSAVLESVRKAWIRLRFSAPMIALRTNSEPGSHGDAFFSSYECPKSNATVVSKWVDETLKWHPEKKTLVERDLDLKDVWWNPGDNHWNMVMHVGRLNGNIQLMLTTTHWAIDGPIGLQLSEKFFEYLAAELEGKAGNIEELPWGEEIVQLPPSMAAVIAPPYRGEVAPPPLQMDGIPNFFHRPVYSEGLNHSTCHSTLGHSVKLTAVQTQAFRDNCKARGFTATPVFNAILVLADVETALKNGIRKGPDAFREVHKSFLSADGFFIPVNGVNRRSAFLPEHASLASPLGTPTCAAEAFPTVHDMNAIRKCIRVDGNMEIERVMSQDAFWDGAVTNAHEVLASGIPIPPYLLGNQKALNGALASRTLEVIKSGILSTSLGDFDKANILERWKPSKRDSAEVPAFTIENIILSARMTQPTVMCSSWQYDGQITLHLHGAREFHDEHAWRDFVDAVESRLRYVAEGRL